MCSCVLHSVHASVRVAWSIESVPWGAAAKLVPVGFGIKKLQITCVIEDAKVESMDAIIEDEIVKCVSPLGISLTFPCAVLRASALWHHCTHHPTSTLCCAFMWQTAHWCCCLVLGLFEWAKPPHVRAAKSDARRGQQRSCGCRDGESEYIQSVDVQVGLQDAPACSCWLSS